MGAPGYAVPESVAEWLEVLATTHIRHPPPPGWRDSSCRAPGSTAQV